jgi:hypothetical protein
MSRTGASRRSACELRFSVATDFLERDPSLEFDEHYAAGGREVEDCYPTATNSHAQLRINATLTPASPKPVYHAANHFLVTVGNNLIRLLIDGHSHTVRATPTVVVSYEIQLGGAYHQVTASAAPHCA